MTESEARVAENLVEEEVTEASEPQPSMEQLLDEQGLEIDFPSVGEIREGVIAAISNSEILVSIGAKSEGVISGRELDQIDAETLENFKVGDTINVYVLSTEDRNGNLAVSYTRAKEAEDWDLVE